MAKPGGYGKYYGEVHYKVPGKGTYTLGRRGFDSGISESWNTDKDVNDVIKEKIEEVKAKQEKIGRSVNVPVAGNTWNVVPERLEQMKQELSAGKTVTFSPHGMGTGYHVSKNPSRFAQKADKTTEDILGVSPLYIESYDHD
jgi:hypothetical protein